MKEQVQGGSPAPRRVRVRYEGRVQGVGFRFTAVDLGARFNITGFVRNEYDGSVELVAEGEEPVLRAFLDAIRLSPLRRYITGEEASWSDGSGEFGGFGVKF